MVESERAAVRGSRTSRTAEEGDVTVNTSVDATEDRPSSTGSSSLQLGPMEVPKASHVLAEELRERILTGKLAPGQTLPPERDLVEQTNMSRATVREALRMLEIQGLLRIRAGRGGGAFVRQQGNDALVNSVELFVRGNQVRMSAFLEAREAIEPTCAALAATRRTKLDMARIDAANEEIRAQSDDLAQFLATNVEWHLAVAEASHNELLSAFMHAISRTLYTSTENAEFVNEDVRARTIQGHLKVTDAIRAGNADMAFRRMKSHVHGYAEEVLQVETRAEIELADAANDGARPRKRTPKLT